MTWRPRRTVAASTGSDPPVSLLDQLRAEFPEASRADVATALEQAHAVTTALEGNADVGRGRLAALARDRLDVLRIRSATASRIRRPPGPVPDAADGAAGRDDDGDLIRPLGEDCAESFVTAEGVGRFGRLLDLVVDRAGRAPVDADCLCRTAVDQLGAIAVAVSVPGGQVTAQTIGVAGPLARRMEELQVVLGEGPSLDAMAGGTAVLVDDLAAAEQQARWPMFAPAAADAGVGSVCVLPMRVGAARFGVLVLYLDRPGGVGPGTLAEALTFAGIALELLLDCPELATPGGDRDPAAAREFFDDRPEIHQATGMVSAQLGVDLGTALLRMRARAFAEGRLLSEIAADVVARRLRLGADRQDDDRPRDEGTGNQGTGNQGTGTESTGTESTGNDEPDGREAP